MNFAAMRGVLEGERGNAALRFALKKMSSVLQIESLWRFNSKYCPQWMSRHVVYDTPEHLVPASLAMLRAESLSELPGIGRLIEVLDRRGRSQREAPSQLVA